MEMRIGYESWIDRVRERKRRSSIKPGERCDAIPMAGYIVRVQHRFLAWRCMVQRLAGKENNAGKLYIMSLSDTSRCAQVQVIPIERGH